MTVFLSMSDKKRGSDMYTMVIAEDEKIELKALNLLIQKEFPEISVVGLAENGLELVSLVEKLQPDMAIVDINMPGINGLDAVDILRARGVSTRFIINTAYNDFEYVQQALSLKVEGYILKPQKRSETIAAIRKLCNSIDEDRANTQSQRKIQDLIWRIQPAVESEIMYSIFINEPASKSFTAWCEMHSIKWCMGVMVSLLPANENRNALKNQEKGSLYDVLQNTLESSCIYLAAITGTSINLLIFVPKFEDMTANLWRNWISDVLQVLLNKLNSERGLLMKAGVGSLYHDFSKMTDSYRESLLALRNSDEGPVNFYSKDIGNGICMEQLLSIAHSLIKEIYSGQMQNIDSKLSEFEQLAFIYSELPLQLWRLCQSIVLEDGNNGSLMRAFFRTAYSTIEQEQDAVLAVSLLREKLYMLARLIKDERGAFTNTYVSQAIQFIEDHYDQDISLESLAGQIGISPFYLSRLFKSEIGQTFVEYLTQLRVQEAIKLASNTRLSIKEIAGRTGYQNPTYFCRIFKKYTGRTIGEIREQRY